MIYFSCRECKYSMLYPDGDAKALVCQHPAIKELSITEDDTSQVEHLANNILKLKYGFVFDVDMRFNFPFQYDPVWIVDCKGFEK